MVATTGHLTLKDIAELAQVSRPAVSNWRARYSDFPQPVEESTPRKPLFESAAVVDWLKHNGFFPEDAENELRLTALWAVANLLRNELDVDDIPLVMLTLLALDRDASFSVSSEYEVLKASISGETLKEVQQGIASLQLEDYGKAAQLVVDRFLGIGSRGARSQYGTSTSLSSATVVAAASTTLDDVGTILDPACGIAATLVGVGSQAPEAHLIGVELEPHIASLAQLLVYLTGYEANIEVGDSLGGDPSRTSRSWLRSAGQLSATGVRVTAISLSLLRNPRLGNHSSNQLLLLIGSSTTVSSLKMPRTNCGSLPSGLSRICCVMSSMSMTFHL